MIKRVEKSAKTTDAAVALALAELGCTREQAVVEELVKPSRGFFGIGAVEAKVAVSYTLPAEEFARWFLTGILERMGVTAEVSASVNEEGTVCLAVRGEGMGVVIGRRGDTLDALQYITSIAVAREQGEHIRVTVDTEGYRAKREESLVALANKVAARVQKYKKSVTLEPMSAYERRVIHSALQDVKGVTTFSTGSEPNRRVVIASTYGGRNRGESRRQSRAAETTEE